MPCVRRRDERKKEKKACIRRVDKIFFSLSFRFLSFLFFLLSLLLRARIEQGAKEN